MLWERKLECLEQFVKCKHDERLKQSDTVDCNRDDKGGLAEPSCSD